MKIALIAFFILILSKGCSQNDLKNATIEYRANTRGFYQKITIQNQMLYVTTDRDEKGKGTESKIDQTTWKELVTSFEKLDLMQLSNYKAPSEKRFYDGAAIAGMKVNFKDSDYKSVDFDHGNPPVEIADLINKIVSLVPKE